MSIRILAYILAGLLSFGLAGCENDDRNVGDTIEDAAESTADSVEDAGEEIADETEDAADEAEESISSR